MTRAAIFWTFIATVLVFTLGTRSADATEAIPHFKLKRLDGTRFDSRRELTGKPSVVWFMGLEQEASTKALDELEDVYRDYQRDGVQVVAIVSGQPKSEALAELRAKRAPFPILLDPKWRAYGAFKVIAYPSIDFVDAKGGRQFHYSGHGPGFGTVARANIDFLLGRLSKQAHKKRITPGPTSSETLNGGEIYYRVAQRLIESGKRDQIKVPLRLAWESNPPHAKAGADLGLMLIEEGEFEAALGLLRDVEKEVPGSPRVLASKAVAMIQVAKELGITTRGLQKLGEELLRKVLRTNDLDEPAFYMELGRLCESEGDRNAAILHYKRALFLTEHNSR